MNAAQDTGIVVTGSMLDQSLAVDVPDEVVAAALKTETKKLNKKDKSGTALLDKYGSLR